MTVQQSFVDDYKQACSEFYEAYAMNAPTEEQDRLLQAWSAAYRRLLFSPAQQVLATSDTGAQCNERSASG